MFTARSAVHCHSAHTELSLPTTTLLFPLCCSISIPVTLRFSSVLTTTNLFYTPKNKLHRKWNLHMSWFWQPKKKKKNEIHVNAEFSKLRKMCMMKNYEIQFGDQINTSLILLFHKLKHSHIIFSYQECYLNGTPQKTTGIILWKSMQIIPYIKSLFLFLNQHLHYH